MKREVIKTPTGKILYDNFLPLSLGYVVFLISIKNNP
jgi:hypothetical protein